MLFNSVHFALFFPIIFLTYWFIVNKNLKSQNILLLFSSYFFYACWDWRFLFVLVFSTFLDYFSGLKMSNSLNQRHKKFWLILSISVNLGILGVFKYYNFFANSFAESISHLGFNVSPLTLNIVLPIGISFYTFHGISYLIDIYRDKIKAEKNIVEYAVFVSFFPLLVAGPIERATNLLPQLKVKREFDYTKAVDGLRQILWGLVKKVFIADNCAEMANLIFNNSENCSGSTLVLGALFFSIQIYGDFSGYSDIALGTARLLGIELLQNFSFPYFSRDIAEFWRRWHISLSSWFREYVYIPLGGSKGSTWLKVRNTFIIFILSGFWHGANWTFLIWGALNAIYFLPLLLLNRNRQHLEIVAKGKLLPSLKEFINISITFSLTVFAWIFFRANNVEHAINYISRIFSASLFSLPSGQSFNGSQLHPVFVTVSVLLFILIEWVGREEKYALAKINAIPIKPLRWFLYYSLCFSVLYLSGKEQQFIYFQF